MEEQVSPKNRWLKHQTTAKIFSYRQVEAAWGQIFEDAKWQAELVLLQIVISIFISLITDNYMANYFYYE